MSVIVCVVDPNRLSREGLLHILGDCDLGAGFDAADVDELATAVGGPPELVLLNGNAGPARTVRDAAWLRERYPAAKIVVLSDLEDPAALLAYVASELDGIVSSNVSTVALARSLHLVLAGERVFPSALFAIALGAHDRQDTAASRELRRAPALSEREIEVLEFLVAGETNKAIANRLGIAEATIKVHLKSILRKIHVRNRTQAAIWAMEQGLNSLRPTAAAA